MNNRICTVGGCGENHYAKDLCKKHYSRTKPRTPDKRDTFTCEWCGQAFTRARRKVQRYTHIYCSQTCSSEARRKPAVPANAPARKGTALTLAIEDGDHELIRKELLRRTVTSGTCMEWDGPVDKHGYPKVTTRGKTTGPHRLMLESKHRASIGSQAVHHMCGNRLCINPEHLQAVTERDNIAEMLARKSCINRINELEQALKSLDPHSTLLEHAPLAGTRRHPAPER